MYRYQALLLAYILALAFSANPAACQMPRVSTKGSDLIAMTCKHTLYYHVCVSSLRSDPRSRTADLQGLTTIAVDLSIDQGARIISHVTELEKRARYTDGSSWMIGCLKGCMEEYSDAVEDLRQSAGSLARKSYGEFNELVSAAMTDSGTCEDGFKEMPGYKSPLTGSNGYFMKLCSNALAIARLLH